MQIQIETGPKFNQVAAELGSLGGKITAAVSSGLQNGGKIARGVVVRDYLSGQSLKRRSGKLAAELDSWSVGPFEVVVGVPPNSPVKDYAWLLGDETKTITPKKAKALAIPIGENLSGGGVARYPRPAHAAGLDLFTIKSKTGHILLGYKIGKRGKFRPLFILLKSVTIQGSGALADGVLDSVDDITAEIEDELGKIEGVK